MKFSKKNLFKEFKNKADKKLGKKSGFTLVEILIVIAVIGILFVTLVPRIDFASDKSRETGVKTDFRSFELASEQLLRENAGLSNHDSVAELCAANGGINLYLDKGLQFDTTGVSAKTDPWNQEYTIQCALEDGATNPNNGCIVVVSNGKDSNLTTDADNYAIATVFIDGVIETRTVGFSSNIECDSISDITAADATKMTVTTGVAAIQYDK